MKRLLYLTRCLLVGSLLLSTNGLLLVKVAFQVRQQVIAERLCVNRTVPNSTCHGTCYLAKQQQKEQERQEKEQRLELLFAAFQFVATERQAVVQPAPTPLVYVEVTPGTTRPGFPQGIFQPPRA